MTVNQALFLELSQLFLFGQYVLSDVLQGEAVSEAVGVYGL